MREEYCLVWQTVELGKFIRNQEAVVYLPSYESASELEESIAYPDPLFELDKSQTPWRVKKYNPRGTTEILEWLQERVFPRERENSKLLLDALGLIEYDMWEIIKRTEGQTLSDMYRIVHFCEYGEPIQLTLDDYVCGYSVNVIFEELKRED